MAEVHNNQDLPRIKLFGKTILQEKQVVKEESSHKLATPTEEDEDQTIDKRPDKIIPCPRCKSMETKFCYFNNYNVNQPRHFCKGCQRYWTAGGALRNVPIGAGRRKSKPPGRGFSDFPEGTCLFDHAASGMQKFDFDGMVEEWRMAATAVQGGFPHGFPAKRRRGISGGESF